MSEIISNDAVREIITIASQQGILSQKDVDNTIALSSDCLLYTSPSPRDVEESRMPSSA